MKPISHQDVIDAYETCIARAERGGRYCIASVLQDAEEESKRLLDAEHDGTIDGYQDDDLRAMYLAGARFVQSVYRCKQNKAEPSRQDDEHRLGAFELLGLPSVAFSSVRP
jgi:hypothetical protein